MLFNVRIFALGILMALLVGTTIAQGQTAPVRFFVISQSGTPATNPSRLPAEVSFLNGWYQGRMSYQYAGATVLTRADHGRCGDEFNPEAYYNAADANAALENLSDCYGDTGAINVFFVKTLQYSGGAALNGIAMIDAPLHGAYPPSVVIAANLFSYGGITLTHEIGHVLGLQHTATYAGTTTTQQTPSYVTWYSLASCGTSLTYPHFVMYSPWRTETSPLHEAWPGRENPMGYLNLMTFHFPSFFKGEYAGVFTAIIDCWKTRSFAANVAEGTATGEPSARPKAIIDQDGRL